MFGKKYNLDDSPYLIEVSQVVDGAASLLQCWNKSITLVGPRVVPFFSFFLQFSLFFVGLVCEAVCQYSRVKIKIFENVLWVHAVYVRGQFNK